MSQSHRGRRLIYHGSKAELLVLHSKSQITLLLPSQQPRGLGAMDWRSEF